jgi:hypothetical protein
VSHQLNHDQSAVQTLKQALAALINLRQGLQNEALEREGCNADPMISAQCNFGTSAAHGQVDWTEILDGLELIAAGPVSEACDEVAPDLVCDGLDDSAAHAADGLIDEIQKLKNDKSNNIATLNKDIGDGEAALGLAQDHVDADNAALNLLDSCSNSFVGSTPVLMANGKTKEIDQIKVGDKITNAQPESSSTQIDTVSAVQVTYTDHDYDQITVKSPDGPHVITSTAAHLYWDVSTHAWTPADNLNTGDQLDTPNNGLVTIDRTRHYTALSTTYNLTISKTHTYYVQAGPVAVLVHNDSCTGLGRELIDGQAQQHIIFGDSHGGGHKWPGNNQKTVFPSSWDTDDILDAVAEVATNPNSQWTWQTGSSGSDYTRAGNPSRVRIEGTYNGVNIRVIYEPANDRFITGFPHN